LKVSENGNDIAWWYWRIVETDIPFTELIIDVHAVNLIRRIGLSEGVANVCTIYKLVLKGSERK
jgi:hypothetical protein